MKRLLVSISYIAVLLLVVVLNAWTLQVLWEWYIIPQFGSAPLAFIGAIGLSLFASFFTYNLAANNAADSNKGIGEVITSFVFVLLKPFVFLFFGWLYLALFG